MLVHSRKESIIFIFIQRQQRIMYNLKSSRSFSKYMNMDYLCQEHCIGLDDFVYNLNWDVGRRAGRI